ncbi:MmcQ/YjbR family DNA-binding protein [Chromobacterium haemolyticum]|uniref:MmcQ/YjbR family DNA-binding protein n=1 Tax=Chromobacterium haemolyticum TaxID=394935 RepID=A0A1W0CS78_9NEIS|nr:MmcQ/YjbR family DNA-binding protein [Chromobacterium haemolyticum]OQS37645.1 hypothetical protein B0T45_14075 [Chromobacterium haemolyticum]
MALRKEDVDALLAQARALPGAEFDIKWETRRVLSLERKMFALFHEDNVMYKVAADDFLVLSGLPGVRPAPYLARARWIEVSSLEALSLEQLHAGIADARRLVLAKLPKAARQRYEAST